MTDEEMAAVRMVAEGKVGRVAYPGRFRVYRDEAGRVVFERFDRPVPVSHPYQ